MTTAIFFDLDGTLLEYTEPFEAMLAAAFEREVGRYEEAWGEYYDEQFFGYFSACEPTPFERAMEDATDAFDLDADPGALADALAEAELAGTRVDGELRTALERLAAENRLGVLTDGVREWQLRKLEHHDLRESFETVVTSYEAGAHKPDGAPYELARERIEADEYVMIGDDYDADVAGARAAGFVPIHFEREGPNFWETLNALL